MSLVSKIIIYGFTVLIELLIAHKRAFENAGILHHDISLVNLFLTFATHRSDHWEFIQKISGRSRHEQDALCTKISHLKQHRLLGDWGYAVLGAKCITTATDSGTDQLPDGAHPPTLPVEIPAEFDHLAEPSNCVPVVPVHSMNAITSLTPISDLTKEDNIVLNMGPGMGNDPCDTIDTSPLYCTVSPSFLVHHIAYSNHQT